MQTLAPMQLKIKASATDMFDVDIEPDETVETLGIVIFSTRPDMGEELIICHKGRPLKNEVTLSAAGMVEGDVIAVAKKKKKEAPAAAETPAAADAPAPAQAADAQPAAAPADDLPKFDPPARGDDGEPKKKSPRLDAASDPSPAVEAPAAAAAETAALPEAATDKPAEAATDEQSADAAPGSPGKEQPSPSTPSYPQVDATTSAGLLAFASLIEGETGPPPHFQLAELMRDAAQRMNNLENTVKELAQGMQMVNMISATTLRGLGASEGDGGSSPTSKPADEEGSRSFLIKKGDTDLQEKHAASSAPMYRQVSGGATGGSQSKEDMQKARQARLAALEKAQADKQKEKDDANERHRAREAMFNRRDEGKSKPLPRP